MAHPVLAAPAPEVRDTSSHAIYNVHNDEALGSEPARVTATQPASTGQQAGVTTPNFLVTGKTWQAAQKEPTQI